MKQYIGYSDYCTCFSSVLPLVLAYFPGNLGSKENPPNKQ